MWRVTLDVDLGHAEACRALLSPDEIDRADRFVFDRDRSRFTVCRATLRTLLASCAAIQDPRAVEFSYGSHGKPGLATAASGLEFNVAHTGGFALMGFAPLPIGIDVEHVHDLPDMDSVMRSFFAPGERARIDALSGTEARDAFFRCWTRKEAVLKALGWGLAKPLDSFEVSVDEDSARLLRMDDVNDAQEWKLVHVPPGEELVGAAAWAGSDLTLHRFTYDRPF